MLVDPVDLLAKTSAILVPTTTTALPSMPTVVPDRPTFQHATKEGYRTFWVAFAIFLIASVGFVAWSWTIPVSRRIFHSLTSLITIIATLSYFALATGGGSTAHHALKHHHHKHVPDVHTHVFRQIFWAHYVDWFLTTPLILLNLGFFSGLSGAHILQAVVAAFIMNLAGLFSTLGHHGHGSKWGWYAIACIAYLTIVWHLFFNGRSAAKARGNSVSRSYLTLATYTIIVWAVFPVFWAVAGGKRLITVNGEIVAYVILDILAKVVFGVWLLFSLKRTPAANVELSGFWATGANSEGRVRLGDDDQGA